MAAVVYLRQEVVGAYYRAGHKRREEAQKEGIFQPCARRLYPTLVHIYYIAYALKGVERNAYRQYKFERLEVMPHQRGPVPQKEVGVFEVAQHSERCHKRGCHTAFAPGRRRAAQHKTRQRPVE